MHDQTAADDEEEDDLASKVECRNVATPAPPFQFPKQVVEPLVWIGIVIWLIVAPMMLSAFASDPWRYIVFFCAGFSSISAVWSWACLTRRFWFLRFAVAITVAFGMLFWLSALASWWFDDSVLRFDGSGVAVLVCFGVLGLPFVFLRLGGIAIQRKDGGFVESAAPRQFTIFGLLALTLLCGISFGILRTFEWTDWLADLPPMDSRILAIFATSAVTPVLLMASILNRAKWSILWIAVLAICIWVVPTIADVVVVVTPITATLAPVFIAVRCLGYRLTR